MKNALTHQNVQTFKGKCLSQAIFLRTHYNIKMLKHSNANVQLIRICWTMGEQWPTTFATMVLTAGANAFFCNTLANLYCNYKYKYKWTQIQMKIFASTAGANAFFCNTLHFHTNTNAETNTNTKSEGNPLQSGQKCGV